MSGWLHEACPDLAGRLRVHSAGLPFEDAWKSHLEGRGRPPLSHSFQRTCGAWPGGTRYIIVSTLKHTSLGTLADRR